VNVNPTSGLSTTEAGGTAAITVALDSLPTAGVTIHAVTSTDLGEGVVSPSSLVFSVGNWDRAQTLTVTGVDDVSVDGDIAYAITSSFVYSSDTNFHGVFVADVAVTNMDGIYSAYIPWLFRFLCVELLSYFGRRDVPGHFLT
jgi:hypothetical protein